MPFRKISETGAEISSAKKEPPQSQESFQVSNVHWHWCILLGNMESKEYRSFRNVISYPLIQNHFDTR